MHGWVQSCEKRDAVPEILAFTFFQVYIHSYQLTVINKNKDTNRCMIPV